MTALKELLNKLENKYLDMTFQLSEDAITSKYNKGMFVCSNIPHNGAKGILVQYVLFCKNVDNEEEILSCLNEINSEYDLSVYLSKSENTASDDAGIVYFTPLYIPLYNDIVDVDDVLMQFNQLKFYLTEIDKEGTIDKILNLIK